MPILVHEAICVSVWREKILPLLLKITPKPKSVFVPYMVVSKNCHFKQYSGTRNISMILLKKRNVHPVHSTLMSIKLASPAGQPQ